MRTLLDKIKERPALPEVDENVASAPVISHIQHIRHYMDQYEFLILSIDQNVVKIDEEIKKVKERLDHLHRAKEDNLRAKQIRIDELNDVLQIVQNKEGEQNAQHTNNRR
jgi:hypothetical protein